LNQAVWIQEAPACPEAIAIDGMNASVITSIGSMAEEFGFTVNSTETVKAFVSEKCGTVNGTNGGCISKGMVPLMEAITAPACAGTMSDDEVCRTDPIMMNETCAMKLGAAQFGVEEAVIKAIWTTGVVHCATVSSVPHSNAPHCLFLWIEQRTAPFALAS
jgi:hypothetical protein